MGELPFDWMDDILGAVRRDQHEVLNQMKKEPTREESSSEEIMHDKQV